MADPNRELLESAFIDGASNFTIFTKLILPLSVPALASFAIFQFLWVWNDYLVALTFLGVDPSYKVLTQRLADLTGTFGNQWHLLTAGAFVTMILPMLAVTLVLEELTYRTLIQGRLAWFLGAPAAIGVASLLFGLAHYAPGPALIVSVDIGLIVLDSILYGMIFARRNNLWMVWLAHLLGDILGLLVLNSM